jgi:pimeloyl-ACP methyl ester carboxylesterase
VSPLRPLATPVDLGSGPPVVILPGYAMSPGTYGDTAKLLADRCRVVVPDIYGVSGRWRYREVVGRFSATLDELGWDRATLVAHSFGGGIQLGFAAAQPERVVEAVFVDTLAVAREWLLAREAMAHPVNLLRMGTKKAATAFIHNFATHPLQLMEAAWWGFTSARQSEIEQVSAAGVKSHVLWASRDSLLERRDGEAFAEQLSATFTVAEGSGRPVDHDWMYRHPQLFIDHLEKLGLAALSAT